MCCRQGGEESRGLNCAQDRVLYRYCVETLLDEFDRLAHRYRGYGLDEISEHGAAGHDMG